MKSTYLVYFLAFRWMGLNVTNWFLSSPTVVFSITLMSPTSVIIHILMSRNIMPIFRTLLLASRNIQNRLHSKQLKIFSTSEVNGPKKAVLFHIHGGGFNRGTAREYEGKFLSAKEDIVIVTINYRLNIFGYFDSDGDGVWENFGLWDIKLALQWVQQNIAAFGGDKDRVTIFGGSAGGMAVTMLGASPEFSGLFHRMIGDSGTLTCPKLLYRDPQDVFNRVLKESGCENRACLMQVSEQPTHIALFDENVLKIYCSNL